MKQLEPDPIEAEMSIEGITGEYDRWYDHTGACRRQVFFNRDGTITYDYWYDTMGFRHRIGGPALYDYDNGPRWFLNGECIECKTQKEFEQYLRLKAFW